MRHKAHQRHKISCFLCPLWPIYFMRIRGSIAIASHVTRAHAARSFSAKIVSATGPGRELSPYGGGNRIVRSSAFRRFRGRCLVVKRNTRLLDRPKAEPRTFMEAEGVEPSSRGRLKLASTCVGLVLSRVTRRPKPDSAKHQPLLSLSTPPRNPAA